MSARFNKRWYALVWAIFCFAMPMLSRAAVTASDVAITDVSPRSFAVFVHADRIVNVTVQVYANPAGTQAVSGITLDTQATISGNSQLITTAHNNGLKRVVVRGLSPNTPYFYRVTIQPVGGGASTVVPASGPLPSVVTPIGAFPVDNPVAGLAVNLVGGQPADGTFVVAEMPGLRAPLTHIVGDAYPPGIAAVNLDNLHDTATRKNAQTASGSPVNVVAHGGMRGSASVSAPIPGAPNTGGIWFVSAGALALNGTTDSDADGLPDEFERRHGLNPAVNDAALDADGDGLTNLQEYQLGSNPRDVDTDADGLTDGAEVSTHGTHLTIADTDRDGLSDSQERLTYGTNAVVADTDADGALDGEEIAAGTNPTNASSVPLRDPDGDGIGHAVDNCQTLPNPNQANNDNDAFGDVCDSDDDNDGVLDINDNAPFNANANQADGDLDGRGDVADNCPGNANADQANHDADAMGDACDADDDNDGILDFGPVPEPSTQAYMVQDIVRFVSSTAPVQVSDRSIIEVYKVDLMSDVLILIGKVNLKNRVFVPDPQFSEADRSIQGPLVIAGNPTNCTNCYSYPSGSRVVFETDRGEISIALLPAILWNGNGSQPGTQYVATDGSLYAARVWAVVPVRLDYLQASGATAPHLDNCQFVPNPTQQDADGDGKGDACEGTPNDLDGDGIANAADNCPQITNVDQANLDGDSQGDVCDPDIDGDGIANDVEFDALGTDPGAIDSNGDGISDGDEDFDFDGVTNRIELARGSNPQAMDTDLKVGLNLVHFPTQPTADFSAFDLLTLLGGSSSVARIERVVPDSALVPAAYYENGAPAGEDFAITSDQAYMVTMLQARRQTWSGAPLCRSVQFVEGKQLLGFGCVPKGLTAHALLEALGASSISALQRVNPRTRRFESVMYDGPTTVGRDFALTGVAGYIAHLSQATSTNLFALSAPSLTLTGLVDGQILSDRNLAVGGLVSDPNSHVSVNGRSAQLTAVGNGARFATAPVELEEGLNTLTVSVRGANNLLLQRTINVRYAPPPIVVVQSHTEGQVTPSASTTVQGTVSDPLAVVTVNGRPAIVTNGTFEVFDIPLAIGPNTIEVVAIGANQGVARRLINLTSTPIYLMFPGPSAGSRSGQFEMFLSNSQFAAAQMYNYTFNGPGTFTFSVTQALRTQPNSWRFDFTTGVTSAGAQQYGEKDFTVTMRTLTQDLSRVVRREDIRFRFGVFNGLYIAIDGAIAEGTVTQSSTLRVTGRAIGQAQELRINGVVVPLSGTATVGGYSARSFVADVPLEPGPNYIEFSGTSTTGLVNRRELTIHREDNTSLAVKITSPHAKDSITASSVEVHGTVSNADTNVTVNGVAATLTPAETGATFTVQVPLPTGVNRLQAIATFGGASTGDQVILLRGPFDFRLTMGIDRSILHGAARFRGVSAVPLQSVKVDGIPLGISGNTFGGYGGTGTLLTPTLARYTIVATAQSGQTLTFDVHHTMLRQEYTIPNPGRKRVEIEVDVPDDMPDTVVNWKLATSVKYSPNLRHEPFPGKFDPVSAYRSSPTTYKLVMDVQAHGQPMSTPNGTMSHDIYLLDAAGQTVVDTTSATKWNLDTNPGYRAAFITNISNGDVTSRVHGQVFGVLPNIQAQSVRVNGIDASFDQNDFWLDAINSPEGDFTYSVEVTATDGQVFTDSVQFRVVPLQYTIGVGTSTPAHQIPALSHERGTFFAANYSVSNRPSWLPNPSGATLSTPVNNRYFRDSPLVPYYLTEYTATWISRLTIPAGDWGIWEMGAGIGSPPTGFRYWVNFTPFSAPVEINLLSHSNGQSVSGNTAVVRIATPNNGFSNVIVNNVPAVQSYVRRTCCTPERYRIDTTHTATIPLVLGTNTITVTASGYVPSTMTFTLNRTQ